MNHLCVYQIKNQGEGDITSSEYIGLVGTSDKCGTFKCVVGEDVFGCLLCYKQYHLSCGPLGPICYSCLMN